MDTCDIMHFVFMATIGILLTLMLQWSKATAWFLSLKKVFQVPHAFQQEPRRDDGKRH